MARPLKEIDKKQFENLCGLQCTLEEICGFFDVTDKTWRDAKNEKANKNELGFPISKKQGSRASIDI